MSGSTDPGPDRDALEAAEGLTAALGGIRDDLGALRLELEAARKDVRRSKRIIAGLVISFCVDLVVTAGFGYNTVRVNDTQDASRANLISACRQANVNRGQDIAIWNKFLGDLVPAPARTGKVQAELAGINQLIRIKDTPRNCVTLYGP